MIVSELIVENAVKRTRKVISSTFNRKTKKSPLAIYIGMLLHAKTRKKSLVNKFYELGISIPYSRVLKF